jgi:hypothetical protein
VLANYTAPSRLAPSPGVQRHPGHQEVPFRQPADPGAPLGEELVDLGLLAALQGVGSASTTAGPAGEGLERHVADPQGDAALGDAEAPGDLGQGQPGAAQLACLLPFGELAPVAHGGILP